MLISTQSRQGFGGLLDYGVWHITVFCQLVIVDWRQHCNTQARSSAKPVRWRHLVCRRKSSCIDFVVLQRLWFLWVFLLVCIFLLQNTSVQVIFRLPAGPVSCVLATLVLNMFVINFPNVFMTCSEFSNHLSWIFWNSVLLSEVFSDFFVNLGIGFSWAVSSINISNSSICLPVLKEGLEER